MLLSRGKVDGFSLERFEDATGLKLTDANGLKDELPPITTFLNSGRINSHDDGRCSLWCERC